MIVYLPPILGLSYARLFHRLQVLQEHDCLYKIARVMALTDAKFAQRFPPVVESTSRSIAVAEISERLVADDPILTQPFRL